MTTVFHAPKYGLPQIPKYHIPKLDDALMRYYVAKGLADVDTDGEPLIAPEIVAADRYRHRELLQKNYVSDVDIIAFMHQVSGLSRALCATWNYLDNIAITQQGCQPVEVLVECYEYTLEVIEEEGAKV